MSYTKVNFLLCQVLNALRIVNLVFDLLELSDIPCLRKTQIDKDKKKKNKRKQTFSLSQKNSIKSQKKKEKQNIKLTDNI